MLDVIEDGCRPLLADERRTSVGLLSACVVLPLEDSLRSIFTTLGHAAEIHQAGGGTGYTFTHLRPAGDRVAGTGGTASGPLSFLRLYDTAAGVVQLGGRRRSACMAVLDASHPDIYDFVAAKADTPGLEHFNLSVGVTDAFLRAVERDGTHRLVNPRTGKTVARVSAVELFAAICEAAHACGDPGLVFLDAINRANPLPGRGRIEATNPCGEVPLLPFESCNLGLINLARMCSGGRLDWDRLAEVAELAVRFLDDVIDVNDYPFPELDQASRATRKIGLGMMGLAELLATLGIPYDSQQAVRLAGRIARHIQQAAHVASAQLAEARGSFPAFAESRFAHSGPAQRAGHIRRPDRHHFLDRRHHCRYRADVRHRLHPRHHRPAPVGGKSLLRSARPGPGLLSRRVDRRDRAQWRGP